MKAVDDLVENCLKIADYYISRVRLKGVQKTLVRQKAYSRIKRLDLVGLQMEVQKYDKR